MKVLFAGTPDFAVPTLEALINAGHEIVMVLTQPDRPAGRGMKLRPSPVKALALQHGLEVFQPETLKTAEVQQKIAAAKADVMVVAAYGLIIPTVVLNMPRRGCLNVHASLLPRWRGAAPIQRAILAGDAETGVTIMEVVPALDAGAMVKKAAIPITELDTAQTLHDSLAKTGGLLMAEVLCDLDKQKAEPQNESLVTYAEKLQKTESPLDWTQDAIQLSRQVRAFNPFPVAQATMKGEVLRIWFARAVEGRGRPGEVIGLEDGIVVACGRGALCIENLQRPGGRQLDWKNFLAGMPLKRGDSFDA